MERPIMLIVDDDPAVLGALAQDLGREYGSQYRVVRAPSGAAALEALRRVALRGEAVALLIADQRMPEMTGVEFLAEAIKLFPDVKRVLLTAYADTDAAIRAINEVRLDYYLSKPWDPPEERLYPILNDLLDDWQASVPQPFEGLRLVGHPWSARSHEIKDFLARNLVPYQWVDVEADADARRLVQLAGAGPAQLPLVLFPDGATLVQPTIVQLAERLGLRMRAERPSYDLVIVGGGPAGLAAAVYGASEGLHTLLVEREAPGGQAGTTSRIENYLGFPSGLSGADLTRRAVAQASRFGAEILAPQEVTSLRLQDNYRVVTLSDGSEVAGEALLIATGVSYRRLDIGGCDKLTGAGVYYGAAIPEALESQGKRVFIVGGGNSAGQAAMYLSKYARDVTILVRGPSLAASMSQYLIAQIEATDNITVRTRTSVAEMLGETHLEALRLAHADGDQSKIQDPKSGGPRERAIETVPADALFIYIGASPRTDWIGDLVERDAHGFILSGADVMRDDQPPRGWSLERDPFWLETSVPGIFVAGDVRHGSVKRIASAAGEGAMAITFVHQHLAGPPAQRVGRGALTTTYVDALRASPIFAGLADRDLELLAEMAQPIDVPAGQVVIEEGEMGDTLYVVLEGELEVFTQRSGQAVQLAVVGKGHVIGEMAVLQQAPRTASVRTLVNSRLLVISQATFLKMLMKNAGALREVLRTFATRVKHNESAVMQQARMAALGTLAAGLAHQLNNPAAAIVRSAAHLRDALPVWDRAAADLSALHLDTGQRARLDRLREAAHALRITPHASLRPALADPLARSDQEEQLRDWLVARGVEPAWEVIEPLVTAGWDRATLESLADGLAPAGVPAVLRWLATAAATFQTLHEITTSASAISELVHAVRAYSYVDRAPVQNVDVREGLENTLVMLRYKLQPGVRIMRDYAADLPRIEAYGGELNQVWTILVDNAVDAMQGQGELLLRAYRRGDDVVVEVRDSGPGIPPEIQPRIFDPFFTTKPLGSGTGLGLHIARSIVVERGQGQITVASQPGETCFQVRLPIRLTEPVRSPKSEVQSPES